MMRHKIGYLFKNNTTLAYERGLTDGGRHATHRAWMNTDKINREKVRCPAWGAGFELGVQYEKEKRASNGH